MILDNRTHRYLESNGLGVDIGSQVVKMLQLRRVANRVDVQAAGMFAYDVNTSSDGVISDPRHLGLKLKEHLRSIGIQASAAVMSVPSQLAALRWVNLPVLPPDDLRDAARFRVKRHLPFSVDTAYVEATPPDLTEDEHQGPSLVVAVPKAVVDSRAEVLEWAGLMPVAAELEAQAILRIIEHKLNQRSALWRDATVTIIDLGSVNTHMYVVQNRRLQFMRGIKFGSERIARGVAASLDIPYEEVERAMGRDTTELGSDGMLRLEFLGQPLMVNVCSDLDKLTLEFLRLLRYFRSLHPERSYAGILDHVIICGGLAGLHGFAEYLHGALGLQVERARPFSGMVGRFNRTTFDAIVNRQEAFTVVLGLALACLESERRGKGIRYASREYVWAR